MALKSILTQTRRVWVQVDTQGLLAQIQKYTIPQNALRHLYAGFHRHQQLNPVRLKSAVLPRI